MSNSQQHTNPADEQIKQILQKYKKVAVVGLSPDSSRPSNGVARYLQSKGFTIIPVNPEETQILGEKAYPDLSSIPEKVEIVDIFRRPEYVPPIVNEAIKIGAKVIWMQKGVINYPAALKASQNGIMVVMDRCMFKDCRVLCE
ncbi:MAG: CoA-binding protein [candidate division Zixibacteria bacterium SM23_73_3]|nr:MAG: CoA-binding protein [candidate division Zixibacteria bacterium SM23_73_3]